MPFNHIYKPKNETAATLCQSVDHLPCTFGNGSGNDGSKGEMRRPAVKYFARSGDRRERRVSQRRTSRHREPLYVVHFVLRSDLWPQRMVGRNAETCENRCYELSATCACLDYLFAGSTTLTNIIAVIIVVNNQKSVQYVS